MISTIKMQYVIAIVIALVFVATSPAIFAQAAEMSVAEETATGPGGNELATAHEIDAAVKLEVRRQSDELRNELRRQYLDDRVESINRWLAIVAIALTLVGLFGFREFWNIRAGAREAVKKARESAGEASRVADEAIKYVKEIEKHKQQAEEGVHAIREVSKDTVVSAKAAQPEKTVENTQQSPEANMLKKEIAKASSLHESGEIESAIEKWRAIANFAEEVHKKTAANAWNWVGYLTHESKDKISAYSRSIHCTPQNNEYAYFGRGFAKAKLERYQGAIEDYDEVIRLNKEHAVAYLNRSLAKQKLNQIKEAHSDIQTALNLARDAGKQELAIKISDIIERFYDQETE